MFIWVDTPVYEHLKAHGCYEDLYVVSRDTYADKSAFLEIMLDIGDKKEHTDLLCMRGSILGQRRRSWGLFGHNRAKYQYEYNVAYKISNRIEYVYKKTGQTTFHIPIKDRWKDHIGHHYATKRAFLKYLTPTAEGMTTLTVDDWGKGLVSFMLVKDAGDIEREQVARRLFESAHKQYLIGNIGVNTNDTSYPHI